MDNIDNTEKHSVLIVDDDHSNILALTLMLKSEYTIYAAKSGRDAIETATDFLPDIILLDIVMPDMDGFSVLTALKNDDRTRNIPVVFITGLGDATNEEKGLSLGAVDYIIKPFAPAIVKIKIGNQIKLIKQIRQSAKKENS